MLKGRILKGNWQLNQLHVAIVHMPMESPARPPAVAAMVEAEQKMRKLIQELKLVSAACLYIENGKKIKECLQGPPEQCYGCPSDYWPEKKLMEMKR